MLTGYIRSIHLYVLALLNKNGKLYSEIWVQHKHFPNVLFAVLHGSLALMVIYYLHKFITAKPLTLQIIMYKFRNCLHSYTNIHQTENWEFWGFHNGDISSQDLMGCDTM